MSMWWLQNYENSDRPSNIKFTFVNSNDHMATDNKKANGDKLS
jgi:hypothetical protein